MQIIDDSIECDYLYYYLVSKKEYVNEIGRGVAQNNINLKILREMKIDIPSIDMQKKISEILNRVSHLITLREQQLEKLDVLVKSRFVEMFGDPVENPMGWNE